MSLSLKKYAVVEELELYFTVWHVSCHNIDSIA